MLYGADCSKGGNETFTHAPNDTLAFPSLYICYEFCVLCIFPLAFVRYELHSSLSQIIEYIL
jgi:hypothetical protein